jgi:hypothetical protein
MDTSETYIKMCEKATEIQTEWKPNQGDLYCYQENGPEYYVHMLLKKHNPQYLALPGYIWLPRQAQLQEMVDAPYQDDNPERQSIGRHAQLIQLVRDIDLFSQQINLKSITSMEQLWLAFIMKAKYGKVWNGTDWARELMAESAVSDL